MARDSDTEARLERAVHAANTQAVLEILRELEPRERAALREFVLRLGKLTKDSGDLDKRAVAAWGKPATVEQHEAALAAVIVCGTSEEVARVFRYSSVPLLDVVREFRPPSTDGLGDALIRKSPQHIGVVQQLIVEGLIERPVTDAYILGALLLRPCKTGMSFSLGAGDWLELDPGFPAVLMRLFEVEGEDNLNLAAVDRRTREKDGQWSLFLRELVVRGVLARPVVHDKLLTALASGWPAFRAQWFSAFHDSLAFTGAEMEPHAMRYLALVSSNSPATVSFALDAVKTIDAARPFDVRVLLEGVSPALSSSGRAHVEAALRLVDAAVARDPALAAEAATHIAAALAHDSAGVQAQVLKRLATWPASEKTCAVVASSAKSIAAINRPQLMALAQQATPAPPPARASQPIRAAADPLDPAVRIAPVESAGALVECVAYFLENESDIDELERAIAGLMSLAPFDQATRARLVPLATVPSGWVGSVSCTLCFFMEFLLTGKPVRDPWGYAPFPYRNTAHQQLCLRLDELMEFFHLNPRCAPLSTPTHARGFIDPAVLIERIAGYRARGVRPGPWDAMVAVLRLAPVANPSALAAARALGDDTLVHAVRYALGEEIVVAEPELRVAAARIRSQHMTDTPRPSYGYRIVDNPDCPGLAYEIEIEPPAETAVCDPMPADEATRTNPNAPGRRPMYLDFAGNERPCINYFASLLPADPEGFFASWILAKVNRPYNLPGEAISRNYLLPLLHTASLGPMGTLLIAVSLPAKEDSHASLAVEALLRARALGQLDISRLVNDVRSLVGARIAPAGRYVKCLRGAYAQEPQAASMLLELLGAILGADREKRLPLAPRDATAALELMVEMVLAQSLTVPPDICAVLTELKMSAKGSALRKQLLARASG